MSKKKPKPKPKATDQVPGLKESCEEIVSNLYAEVDRVESERLAAHSSEMEVVQAAITELSVRLSVLERRSNGPIRRFLRRLLGRQ